MNAEEMPNPSLSLVARTLTNERGEFRVGPIYVGHPESPITHPSPASLLTIRLQKPGFEFSLEKYTLPVFDWTFVARKLALVELRVLAEDNKPLLSKILHHPLKTVVDNFSSHKCCQFTC